MDDLNKYIKNRKSKDPEFAENFDEGYNNFKIGILLRQARVQAGVTQAQIAEKMHTQNSAISRIENHSEDIRLSTLESYASALGKKLKIEILEI